MTRIHRPTIDENPALFNIWTRRSFLKTAATGVAGVLIPSYMFADELVHTPQQTEGPFYPNEFPLDTDNDLIIINDQLKQAVGEITHLSGRIMDSKGNPIRNAEVEIWQVDANGRYIHTRDAARGDSDSNFQGFGRFLTGSTGEYYFRTIKPVAYGGRAPHIHYSIKAKGKERLTTQCYVKGAPRNERDGILRSVRNPAARNSLIVDFKPIPDSKIGELSARFDIVLG